MSNKLKITILSFLSMLLPQAVVAADYQFVTKLDPIIEGTFALPPPPYPAFEGNDSGHEAGDSIPMSGNGSFHYTGENTYIIDGRNIFTRAGVTGEGSYNAHCSAASYPFVVYYEESTDTIFGGESNSGILRTHCVNGAKSWTTIENFGAGRDVLGITSSDGQNFIVLVDGASPSDPDSVIIYDNSTDLNILEQQNLPVSSASHGEVNNYLGLTYAKGSLYTMSFYNLNSTIVDNTIHEINLSSLSIIGSHAPDLSSSQPYQVGYDGNNLIISYKSPEVLYIQGMHWK
jgi:hypothetical protein